jgi:hypothetical protein
MYVSEEEENGGEVCFVRQEIKGAVANCQK